ncbi:NAD(P)/FAD-dependent oxidoreductase [Gimesia sp.]|uniref:NAD(P)/FAD-dependent oxidoreductase n=1 Tax=Gimesia sp. TaxID=2024833 RepID=UPI000C546820|nr:NAD(P)/FAD-dependent oxidoreductase [Gimesia sp.]MAX37149.1 geranylgeranyl reductase [Gimesia sp.]HBL46548.1 NAD(P)/FAD-dependent oxidoreductase [Planctomycetaceae bacterium]|tara:strand:- start:1552 stop:2679 length:1128 start_codon:yes stop_codon:yes gene_type:complete
MLSDGCDILIVGGGPAGSSCAWGLRDSGLDVLILDQATFPRDKVCAGWITPAVAELLDLDLAEYQKSHVLQPITRFRTGIIGGAAVQTEYAQTVSYGIRRCEFDAYLLNRCGARTRLGEKFSSLERIENGWLVNGCLQAKVIIGAGGHFCPVARWLNPEKRAEHSVVLAQETEFSLTPEQAKNCCVQPERPELYFSPDLRGYGWCFLKDGFLNVGIGREGEKNLSSVRDEFVQFLDYEGRIPREILEKFKGHAYRLYGLAKRTIMDDGILLIGDAAGLASPQSGEGIRPAIESGLMAADVLQRWQKGYDKAQLQEYQQKILDRFGPWPDKPAESIVPAPLRQFLGRHLMSTHWFTRNILLGRWFLQQHLPPLVRN